MHRLTFLASSVKIALCLAFWGLCAAIVAAPFLGLARDIHDLRIEMRELTIQMIGATVPL